MYSDDGITWNSGQATQAIEWSAVAYANGYFVAAGGFGGTTDQRIMYSTDGITWTADTTAAGTSDYWYAITYGGGKFYAIGTRAAYALG